MANRIITPVLSHRIIPLLLAMITTVAGSYAQYALDWEASTTVNAGTGRFAPYYMASNRDGVLTQPIGIQERGRLWRDMDTKKRFDYGFGIDVVADATKGTQYDLYDEVAGTWTTRNERPAFIWLQQLYGEIRYRSLFLTIGMKQNNRSLFDSPLGSGDITLSRNARPVPQIRAGFTDFRDIPLTNGWVQIQGEIAYGKTFDSDWLENHYNYYNSFITTGAWFHYKRCYFRTKPSQPFSLTIGMQAAAQFGGYYRSYADGEMTSQHKYKVSFRSFVDVFLQKGGGNNDESTGDQAYYYGNSLGSWDLKMRYRFRDSSELTVYVQSPWEDGSGIGKLNGWDGVWGIEYRRQPGGWFEGAAIEYIDFTNQSGPVHWSPSDRPGTPIKGQATGADNYYNNYMYNGWANYGMSLGSPFLPSPIYNTDGYMAYSHNRVRGFHAAMAGCISPRLTYRAMISYRTSWGTPYKPLSAKAHDTSMMLEADYSFPAIKGLSLKGQLAFDAGNLYGDNFGVLVSLAYKGDLTFKKREK